MLFRRSKQETPALATAGQVPAGAEDTTPSTNEQREAFRALGERLTIFAAIVVGVVIDLLFITAWIGLHQIAEHVYIWLGELHGMGGLFAEILKQLLTWSTLIPIVLYVAHDMYVSARRIWSTS